MTVQRKTKLRESTPTGRTSEFNPYAMVAGAFGIGFVLGGGLFTRLTARLAAVALRAGLMAALPDIKDGLIGVAERTMGDDRVPRSTASERT